LLDELKEKKYENQNPYKTIAINSEKDYIYEEVRILNITTCRKILKNKALTLENFQEEARNLKDINQKKEATKRITVEKELLKNHINISSALAESMKTISFHKELMMMQRCIMGSSDKEILEYYENMIPFGLPL
jgi:predicted ABC-class ATPase